MNNRKPYHGRPPRSAAPQNFQSGPFRSAPASAAPQQIPAAVSVTSLPANKPPHVPAPAVANNMYSNPQGSPAGAGRGHSDQRGGNRGGRSGGGRGGMRGKHMRRPERPERSLINTVPKPAESSHILPVAPGNIRIIPLGGVEKIGMNMTAIEIGNDILVIDAGFGFSDENTPGIDYILPNTKYLEERKDRVRGIIITHGHLDHIGGIPYIMERIGNPPMYTRNLTTLMIKKRQSEFPHQEPIDYKIVEQNDRIKIGEMSIQFFGVTHTIPDSMGIAIHTPYGLIVTPGDFKLDHVDEVPTAEEEKSYAMFDKEKVLLLLGESTNIENPGFSTPERIVLENLDTIVRDIKGRQ